MDEVDVEPVGEARQCGSQAQPAHAADAGQGLEVAKVVSDNATELFRPFGDLVAHDVDLVSSLGETPGPAEEVDRSPRSDP